MFGILKSLCCKKYLNTIFFQIDVSDAEVNYVAENTSFNHMAENPSVNYEHWKDYGFAFKDKGKFFRKGKNVAHFLAD